MVMPKDKNSLMINLDMIGRLRDGPPLEATGVASAVGLRDWLQPYFDTAGFPIAVKDRAPGNSDHASFFNVGVPIVFLFTGLHDEYHTPNDTADLINVQGAVKVTDLAYRLAIDAAKRPARFVFAKDEPKPVAKQGDSPADPAADQPARPTGVRFGIAPADYADDKKGVLIGDVFDGTPAAKAGLKKGDRMMTWNGAAIDTVEAWMPLLRKHKPGDKVDIVFQRDGKEDKVTVTLEARGTPAR